MPKTQFEVRDLRNGDWYWIHKSVFTKYARKVGPIGLALYNAYCLYANSSTSVAYPAIDKICQDLQISRQTVFKYNDILEKHRLIKVKSGKGRKNVNEVYILKIKVNVVTEKVNVVTEKVNDVDTEQELLTRITNKKGLLRGNKRTDSKGLEVLRKRVGELYQRRAMV